MTRKTTESLADIVAKFPSGIEDTIASWTPEQRAMFDAEMAEAEEPCIRCGRVILAGCTNPKCGQPV